MICNPMFQQANPFEAWQTLWLQGLKNLAPQAPAPQTMPAPADMFGQMQAMQNMWMSAFTPQQQAAAPANPFMQMPLQAPKITVTTIELGDMRPYMEMANNMLSAFAPMLNQWTRK